MMGQWVSSASLWMTPNWEEWLICQKVMLPSKETLKGWRNRLTRISQCSTRQSAKSCTWGGTTRTGVGWNLPTWRAALQRRPWKSWCTPGWTWASMPWGKGCEWHSGLYQVKALPWGRRWSYPLFSTGKATSGVLCPVPAFSDKEKHGQTGDSPTKGQLDRDWSISHIRTDRELELFSLEKKKFQEEILSINTNTWRKSAKRMDPGSFQQCPATGSEAIGTNWSTGSSLWAERNTFCSRGDQALANVSLAHRLSIESPFLDIFKIQLYIVINNVPRLPSMRRRIGQGDLQKSLPASAILWFCGTELMSKSIRLILPLPIRTRGQWFYKNTFSSARVKSVTSYLVFRHY